MPQVFGAGTLRPLHVHIKPHSCTQTRPQTHTSVPTCPCAPMHAHTPSHVHRTWPCTSGSHGHNCRETHVRSRLLWGAGQVNRCWKMLPGPASGPGSQNDPPHTPHPSSRTSQQGHAVRPPSVLVSLDADRAHGSVWRLRTWPKQRHCTPAPQPPFLCPALSCLPFLTRWQPHELPPTRPPPTHYLPGSMVKKVFLSGITARGGEPYRPS